MFDLDSTITRQEILPTIAQNIGVYKEMCEITESTMRGEIPFKQSFLQRVSLLKDVPVSKVNNIVREIDLNEGIVDFIKEHKDRCYVVTGNLDVWISGLIQRIGMEANLFCSRAVINNDYIENVFSVIDKNSIVKQMILPFVAVGDGNNDADMIEAAEIGIGFGGVRDIAPSVLACSTHAVYTEDRLIYFLNQLVSGGGGLCLFQEQL